MEFGVEGHQSSNHLGETIRLFNLFHEDWIEWWLWRPLSFFLFFPYVLMHLYSIYRKVERWVHHIHHAQSGSTCFNHDPAATFALAGRGVMWLKRRASHGAWDRVAQSHGLCSLGHISGVQWPTGRWKRQDSRAH